MKALVLALVLTIAGCTQVQKVVDVAHVVTEDRISAEQVYLARNAFNAVQVTATNYLRLPVCGQIPCRTVDTSRRVVLLIRTGRSIRNNLTEQTQNGAAPTSIYRALLGNIGSIKELVGG